MRFARRLLILWFVRLAWVPMLAWGTFDIGCVVLGMADGTQTEMASTRFFAGLGLFLFWFFLVRTFGPWTANRGGRIESDPDTGLLSLAPDALARREESDEND